MASERFLPGVLSKFWSWLKISSNSTGGQSNKIVFQGKDLNGNNYFESVDKFGRLMRFVEPTEMKLMDLPMIPEIVISPEWLRWLRKNRDDPPTEEEMIRNAAIAYLKKQRAAELESEERKNWPELDAKLKQIEAERDFHPVSLFPLYRDLMSTPGQEYMLNRGFYVPDLNESHPLQLEDQQQPQRISSGTHSSDSTSQETSQEASIKLEATGSDRAQADAKVNK